MISSALNDDPAYRIASAFYEDLLEHGHTPENILSIAAYIRTRAERDRHVQALRDAHAMATMDTVRYLEELKISAVVR